MTAGPGPGVLVRTCASGTIGAGHLKRCLALARSLRQAGAQVRFALPALTQPFASWLHDAGFAAHAIGLHADPATDCAASLAAGPAPDWVLVDDYALDARWHAGARAAGCRVAVIDDLANRPLDADLLIDPNEGPDPAGRYARVLRDPATPLLAGCRYALLDPVYRAAPRHRPQREVQSLGIFLGGSDPDGRTAAVLRACRRVHAGPIEVVATSAHAKLDALRELVAQDPLAQLSLDLPDLAAFFARHDLQIGGGGGASWERCCLGAPTLALPLAANQQAVLPALAAAGALALWTGDPLQDEAGLAEAVGALIAEPDRRLALAEASRHWVDGAGTQRVAARLLADRLTLRRVSLDDARLLHDWRNDPRVRAVSGDARTIPWEEHRSWLAQAVADGHRLLLLGVLGELPVGSLRFDRGSQASAARVSIYLDPALTGLGLGGRLLAAGEAAVQAAWPGLRAIEAQVLPDNHASLALFGAAGYRGGDHGLLRKPLPERATP